MKTKGKPKPLSDALFHPPKSLADEALAQVLLSYRKRVASRYHAITETNLEKVLVHPPFHVSPKVDGELWFLVAAPDESPSLCSPNGRVITGALPLLDEAAEMLGRPKQRLILAGELYVLSAEGRPRVGMVSSVLAGGKTAKAERLGFMMFDVVEAEVVPDEYPERLAMMRSLAGKGKRCQVIKTEVCANATEVQTQYAAWVESSKAEGLVVRDSSGSIAKMKPNFSFDVVVVAFTDSCEFPDQAGSVLMAMRREDASFQLLGGCANLGNPAQRRALREALLASTVEADVRHASGSGALYRFVEPNVVIEVVVTDVQTENADGGPVQNRVLEYTKNGWTTLQFLPGASLLHPSMVRVREDKSTEITDVRLSQLGERCHIQALDAKAEKVTLPASQITRREVYTKTASGKLSVRKLVAWKTNKELIASDYPAYVVHLTDYSHGRKTPLTREVRTATNEETAEKIYQGMLEANIKKGWERVG